MSEDRKISDLDEYALIGARQAERAPIDNDSPERRHAVAEIPADGAYDKRRKLMARMDDKKPKSLEELERKGLRPGDLIRPAMGPGSRPIVDGTVWIFSHVDEAGVFFGRKKNYHADHPGTPLLKEGYLWELLTVPEDFPPKDKAKKKPEAILANSRFPEGWPTPVQPTVEARVEEIVAAAIQIEGVTISLPRPARHGTVLTAADWYLKTQPGQEVQGFLTSTGRFVNRIQARHIADIAGQKPGRSGGRDNPELFSEDLW